MQVQRLFFFFLLVWKRILVKVWERSCDSSYCTLILQSHSRVQPVLSHQVCVSHPLIYLGSNKFELEVQKCTNILPLCVLFCHFGAEFGISHLFNNGTNMICLVCSPQIQLYCYLFENVVTLQLYSDLVDDVTVKGFYAVTVQMH